MGTTDGTEKSPTDESERIDPRTRRAATEYLTVLGDSPRADGDVELWTVTSQSGNTYLVDLRDGGVCECPDFQYRDEVSACKHIRRARMALGRSPVPLALLEAADPDLGQHVPGRPRFEPAERGDNE